MDVIPLPSNRPPDRFYRGGRKITEFRESRDRERGVSPRVGGEVGRHQFVAHRDGDQM